MPNNRVAYRRCVHVVAITCLVASIAAITGAYPVRVAQTPRAHAQPPSTPLRLDIVDQIGGASYAVAAAAPYVYAGVGPRLYVLAVDARGGLTAIGRTTILPGVVRDIALSGPHAYLALMDGSPQPIGGAMAVVDVSNPVWPRVRGVLVDRPAYTAIGLGGTAVYLAGSGDWRPGITRRSGIVDVVYPDPDAPILRTRLHFQRALSDLGVGARSPFVFAIEPRSDQAQNVAVRTILPSGVSSERYGLATFVGLPEPVADEGARWTLSGSFIGVPGQVAIAGDRLFLAGGLAGLHVVDLEQGGEPRARDHVASGGCADSVALDADRLAVIDRCTGRLRVYGAAALGRPVEVGTADVSKTAASAVWMGDRLAVAGGTGGGVTLYDSAGGPVREVGRWALPGSLTELGLIERAPGNGDDRDVAGIVVGLGAERVTAFALSRLGTTRAGGTLVVPGANGLVVAGGRAFVPTGEGRRLEVVALDDVDHPRLGPGFAADGTILAVAVGDGPTVYVNTIAADRAARIDALDVGPPGAPQRIGLLYDFAAAMMRSDGTRLYTHGYGGASIVDTTDPRAMKAFSRSGSFTNADVVTAIAPYDDRLYLSKSAFYGCPAYTCNRIALVDVADPAHAAWLDEYFVSEDAAPSALIVDGDHLWAGGGDALRVVDRPALARGYAALAEATTPGTVYAIAVARADGDHQLAYAADGDGGLVILRLAPSAENPPPPPVVTLGAALPAPTATTAPSPPGDRTIHLPFVARAAALPAARRILTLTDEVGGPSRAVAWAGDVIHRGQGGRIVSYDAVDIARLREVGRSAPLPGLIFGLDVDLDVADAGGTNRSTLYAAAGTAGFAVYDLADPRAPALVARVPTGDAAYAVAAENGVAVVAAGDAGVRVFDVSDADRRPRPAGTVSFEQRVTGIQLHRGFAYAVLAEYMPIQVIDVRDPADPRRVAELTVSGDSFGGGASLTLVGDRAYVVSCDSCVYVYSIADPTAPVFEASFFDWRAHTILAEGDRLYLMVNGVQIIDLGDPAAPRAAGDVRLGFTVYAAAASAGRVAIAAGQGLSNIAGYDYLDAGPLKVVDARDVDRPAVVADVEYPFDTAGTLFPTGRPDRLYMRSMPMLADHSQGAAPPAARSRLAQGPLQSPLEGSLQAPLQGPPPPPPPAPVRLVDISDPTHLRLAERVPALDGVTWLRVVGQTGYGAMPRATGAQPGEPSSVVDVTTWDLADVAAPRRLGSVAVDGGSFVLDGTNVYALHSVHDGTTWSPSTLITIDASDPTTPRVRSRHVLPETCWSLAVAGGRAYARAPGGTLLAFDITSSDGPRLIDRITAPFLEGGGDVVATEHDVWIATWRGLAHVDVRRGGGDGAGAAVGRAATLQFRGRFQSLVPMPGGRLIATDFGVSVFDVRTPAARLIAQFDAPDYAPVGRFGVRSPIPIGERVFVYFAGDWGQAAPGPAVLMLSP